MVSLRRYGLSGLLSVAAACAPEVVTSRCTLEKSASIAEEPGLRFDAVKLVAGAQGGLYAIWSERGGVFERNLDAAGVPLAPKARLTERCGGGLDALQLEGELFLACSRPQTTQAEDDEGEIVVYRFDAKRALLGSLRVGPTGRDGRGLALGVVGGELALLYHEGQLHQLVVQSARIAPKTLALTQQEVLSNTAKVASQPAFFSDGSHDYAIWVESEVAAGEKPKAEIWIRRGREAAGKVAESAALEAAPTLSRDERGLVLGYRDKRASDKRNELYVQRLDAALRARAPASRVGRANGEGSPLLARCAALHAAVLPREYGGEHYVAVHELTSELQSLGGGHQYYANEREFVLADVACRERTLTLLVGERASPAQPGIELMTLRFACH